MLSPLACLSAERPSARAPEPRLRPEEFQAPVALTPTPPPTPTPSRSRHLEARRHHLERRRRRRCRRLPLGLPPSKRTMLRTKGARTDPPALDDDLSKPHSYKASRRAILQHTYDYAPLRTPSRPPPSSALATEPVEVQSDARLAHDLSIPTPLSKRTWIELVCLLAEGL